MSEAKTFVEATTVEDLTRCEAEWRDLATRAAEPNAFAESPFLLPALRLAGMRRLKVLFVRTGASLIGVLVLRMPPSGQGLARIWLSEQAGLAAMMWDASRLVEALEAVLAWLSTRPGIAGLILPGVEPVGPLAKAARALAARTARRLEEMNPRRRAALAVAGGASFEAALDGKRRKEWGRQGRRLAELGRLETRFAEGSGGIERFLALEIKGWKGARGTALAADPGRLAFARAMLGAFAQSGRLQIHELTLNDSAVAIGVVLRAGARAFFWKTAYDESFAEFSPGVQLTLALSRRLEREPDLALVDSCALQDHPMIDRIWQARIELVDLAIPVSAGRTWLFEAWLAAERAGRAMRERAKRIINRMRRRKRS